MAIHKHSGGGTSGFRVYKQGRNAWQVGFLGFLVRPQGKVTAALFSIFTCGWPWWISEKNQAGLSDVTRWHLFGGIVTFVVITLLGLEYLRKRTVRSLDIKFMLHQLTHNVRNEQMRVYDDCKNKSISVDERGQMLVDAIGRLCSDLREYFRLQMSDSTIGIAIRLSVEKTPGKKDIVYRTFGRAGLSPGREKGTQDMDANSGIPRCLREAHQGHATIVIEDLQQAKASGLYVETPNDVRFAGDFKSLMVAPLNGFGASGNTQMLGLLCITSRNQNIFKVTNYDSVSFAADLVATYVAHAVWWPYLSNTAVMADG